MAKEKKSKKDKASKATSDQFANPSEAPAGGDSWRLEVEDNVGKLFLIRPLHEKEIEGFEGKEATVIVSDIVEIDEKKPAKSVEHKEVYVWGGWVKGSLRGFIDEGRLVLGRLEQDKAKGRGKNAAWVLEDGDKEDVAIAREYLSTVDPFVTKTDEGGKKKKKKK